MLGYVEVDAEFVKKCSKEIIDSIEKKRLELEKKQLSTWWRRLFYKENMFDNFYFRDYGDAKSLYNLAKASTNGKIYISEKYIYSLKYIFRLKG